MPRSPITYGQMRQRKAGKWTRQQKGYGADWQRFRTLALSDPEAVGLPEDFAFCADCKPRLVPTKEIHHRIRISAAPQLRFTPSNLVGLCKSCHSKRTARGE